MIKTPPLYYYYSLFAAFLFIQSKMAVRISHGKYGVFWLVLSLAILFMPAVFLGYVWKDRAVNAQRLKSKQKKKKLALDVIELVRQKNEMRALLASMKEGVLVVDPSEKILIANEAFKKYFRINGVIEKRFFWELLRMPEMVMFIKSAIKNQMPAESELRVFLPEEKNISAQVSPVYSEEKQFLGAVCVFHDISPMKQAEARRSEFVVNVSHELKTPLTSIRGYLETLQSGGMDDRGEAEKYLNIISRQVLRLEKLVNDLLYLSQLTEKKDDVNLVQFDSNAWLSQRRLNFEPRMNAKKINYSQDIQLKTLVGDPEKLGQVLEILLDNACKYTPEEGRVHIKIGGDGKSFNLLLQNSGPRIAKDHQKRIFERFYREDASRDSQTGGSGLGLAIAQGVMRALGGLVRYQDGDQPSFEVSWPMSPISRA